MITLSRWAKRHPYLSVFLIIVLLTFQILIAFGAGIRLSLLGVYLGNGLKYLAIAALYFLMLWYPSRKRLGELSWFAQRRYMFIGTQIIVWSSFLLIASTTNQMATPDYIVQERSHPFVLKVAAQEQAQPQENSLWSKAKSVDKTWKKTLRTLVKERKAQIRQIRKELRQGRKDGSIAPASGSGTIAGYVFLTLLIGMVAGSLACAITCAGAGILAIILAGGIGYLIFLMNMAGARKAYPGESRAQRKGRASSMSIVGWLFLILGLVLGFAAGGGLISTDI